MANKRDLHIGISGDARGFDAACEEAENKARGLDRELAKLERQQAAQERVTARSAEAVRRFASANDKASLAAHKMGLEAKRAADQAAKAEVRAAAAAEAAAKGILDEEKAARIAARANDAVERAAIKAAEAQLAEAAAAEKLAAAERKAAADADKHRQANAGLGVQLVSAGAAAAGLAPTLGAAGAAFIGFAAVAAPSIAKVLAAQQDLAGNWDSLDRDQKIAAASTRALVNDLKGLAKAYEPDTLAQFNGLISTARGLLPDFAKTIYASKRGVADFSTTVENSLNRQIPRLDAIIRGQATPALHQLGTTFDQTASITVNLLQGLAPLGTTLLTDANGVLRLLNALTAINPHLTEFAVTALALRGPTNALSNLWTSGAGKLSGWGKSAGKAESEVSGLAKTAGKAEGEVGKLGKVVGSSPNLYIGAALAIGYLATRLATAKTSTDNLVASIRTENNAFGNNIKGHQAAAASFTRLIAQTRAAQKAALEGQQVYEGSQAIDGYDAKIRKLTEAQKQEQQAARQVGAGQKYLSDLYGISASQANQLATAAGVDLSKGITGSGDAAVAARAKIQQYKNSVDAASNSTAIIALSLDAAQNSTLGLADRLTALQTAFNALAGPEIAAFDAATQTADAFTNLDAALKKSHGSLALQTVAGRSARHAFTGLLSTVEQNIVAQYQFDSATLGAAQAQKNAEARTRALLPLLLAEAGNSRTARNAVLDWAVAHGVGKSRAEALAGAIGTTKSSFLAAAHDAGISRKEALALWAAFKKFDKPVKLTADDKDFLAKLRNAQGLRIDPKTGLLLGRNSDYLNKWLKVHHLKIDPKTGRIQGDNNSYLSKWLQVHHLRIDTKTGRITGDTSAFWNAIHNIPSTVGYRKIGVYYVPLNSANEPGKTRADGGVDRYASGGLRRDLDPMVVNRPTVLFGETQTGGEAYIPLGLSKRGRSTELLRQVAAEFGLDVVKRIPIAAAPALSGASGGSAAPTIYQTFQAQPMDVHQLAREAAREVAWTLRG